MEFVSARQDVHVTMRRGNGTEFTFVTATPERYGYQPPRISPLVSIKARRDAAQADLDEVLALPVPEEGAMGVHKDHEGNDVSYNLLDYHRSWVDFRQRKLDKAQKVYDQAVEAFGE